MLKAAGFYTAVLVVGTATMILAHKLDPQKPTRSAQDNCTPRGASGTEQRDVRKRALRLLRKPDQVCD
jgi:hypothetical protein